MPATRPPRYRGPDPATARDAARPPQPIDPAAARRQWIDLHVLATSGPDVAAEWPIGPGGVPEALGRALAEIIASHADPAEELGHEGASLALWHGSRLLAVVTAGDGRTAAVMRFDQADQDEDREPDRAEQRHRKRKTRRTDEATPTLF